MTNHPPAFAREAEEQSKWNDGFKAGISEVLFELDIVTGTGGDLEGPTKEWVAEFTTKLAQKYL